MILEPIGIATFALGVLCLAAGTRIMIAAFLVACLFGAAAAIVIGAANIQPGHVALGFAALAILTRRREVSAALRSLAPFGAGFWLACLVGYGLVSAFAFPRLFAGLTEIIPLGESAYDDTGGLVPLGPVSSNFTQSVYMVANLVCFVVVAALASTPRGFRAVAAGVVAYALGNAAFALIDMAAHAAGAQSLLGFMRNARYTLHSEAELVGMKRIVGSFTEASAFARSTLGMIGFTGVLFVCGVRPAFMGPLFALLLSLLVLSTSSTGLAGAPLILGLLYLVSLLRALRPGGSAAATLIAMSAPLLALTAALALALSPHASAAILDYLDFILFNKASTDSAIERGSWNAAAWRNVIDSWGLGVGLGTIRASSFALAVLANVGVLGALFYLAFAAATFLPRPGETRGFHADVRLAARLGCLGLLLGDLMVSPFLDQGLLFYALAALAASRPEIAPAPAARARPLRLAAPALGTVSPAASLFRSVPSRSVNP
jgi:hypothetical protein